MEQQNQQPAGAKNFFLYFLMFALLYTVAFNLGGALFDFIHKSFPLPADAVNGARFSNGTLRFHLASLIIGTPIFLWLSRMIYKKAVQDASMRSSAIRRWLTYITMILTALIVIGDLITLVNNLLGGDNSLRFLLKVAVVLIIAGSIFYYYLTEIKDLKVDSTTTSPLPKLYFAISGVLILATIINGFLFIESPALQRLRNEDQVRVNNLSTIDMYIKNYAGINKKAPPALNAIQAMEGETADPVTKEPYTYHVIDDQKYELCATFMTSNRNPNREDYMGPTDWLHDAGQICFPRTTSSQIPDKGAPFTIPIQVAPAQ